MEARILVEKVVTAQNLRRKACGAKFARLQIVYHQLSAMTHGLNKKAAEIQRPRSNYFVGLRSRRTTVRRFQPLDSRPTGAMGEIHKVTVNVTPSSP
jgi:hypothetical protein